MADNQSQDCSLLSIYRLSTRQKSRRGYRRLGKEIVSERSESKGAKVQIKAKKIIILPIRMLKTTKISKPEITASAPPQPTKDAARSHPLLSFLGSSRQKAAKLKPEFIRYLKYVREGGRWDADSNRPVIYFK